MADGRRENEHEIIIAHACHISKVLTGEFQPDKSNPYKEIEPVRPMTEKERKEANKCGLLALKQALIGLYGNKLKKKKL